MGLISWLFNGPGSCRCSLVAARTPEAPGRITVAREVRPLYRERRWRMQKGELRGHYRTTVQSCPGRIKNPHTSPEFYIKRPPRQLLEGEHQPCFIEVAKHEFRVHWRHEPSDCDAGIRALEHAIEEAIRGGRSRT